MNNHRHTYKVWPSYILMGRGTAWQIQDSDLILASGALKGVKQALPAITKGHELADLALRPLAGSVPSLRISCMWNICSHRMCSFTHKSCN